MLQRLTNEELKYFQELRKIFLKQLALYDINNEWNDDVILHNFTIWLEQRLYFLEEDEEYEECDKIKRIMDKLELNG